MEMHKIRKDGYFGVGEERQEEASYIRWRLAAVCVSRHN